MNKKHAKAFYVAIIIVFAGLSAFYIWRGQQEPDQKGAYDIGVVSPATGSYAEWGQYFNEGARLAKQKLSDSGGPVLLSLRFEDSKSTVKDALSGFNRLWDQHKPIAVLAMDSEAIKAMAPSTTEKGTLLLATVAGGKDLFAEGQVGFRWYQRAETIGNALADYAIESGYVRVAVLYENHVHSLSVKSAARGRLEKEGVVVTAEESFETSADSARNQAAKVLAAEPDVIILTGTGGRPYISAVRSLRDLGWQGPLLCDDSMNLPNVQRDLGKAAVGVIFTATAFNPHDPRGARQVEFVSDYKRMYNGRLPTDTAAYTYELLLIVHRLVAEGNDTSRELADAFESMENAQTVFGEISYEGDHEISLPIVLYQIEERGDGISASPLAE